MSTEAFLRVQFRQYLDSVGRCKSAIWVLCSFLWSEACFVATHFGKKNKQFDALSLCGYEESVKLKFISIDIKYVLSKKKMEHRYRTFSSETCVHM